MKFIIMWNCGYGPMHETVEAKDEDHASEMAYEYWKEDAESNADYNVVGEWTEELAEDCGV